MTYRKVLADAGPLIALASATDQHHDATVAAMKRIQPPLLACWPVVVEAAYVLQRDRAALEQFFMFFEVKAVELIGLNEAALPWISAYMKRYWSAGADMGDSAVMYLAESLGLKHVFTFDRRHFSIYRIAGNRSVTLIP